MEIKDIEEELVKYYGEHQSKHVAKITLKYINSTFSKSDYLNLLQAIIKSHPFNYGFPDVAAIEEAQDKLWKKEGKSLRKSTTSNEWTTNIAPLTEAERKEAEPLRKDWENLLENVTNKNAQN